MRKSLHMYGHNSYDNFYDFNSSYIESFDYFDSSSFQRRNKTQSMPRTYNNQMKGDESLIGKPRVQNQKVDQKAIEQVIEKAQYLPILPTRFDKDSIKKLKKVNGQKLYKQTATVEALLSRTEYCGNYNDIFTKIISLDMEYQLATKSIGYYDPLINKMYNIREKHQNRIFIIENDKNKIKLIQQLDQKVDIDIQKLKNFNSTLTSYQASIETNQLIGNSMFIVFKVSHLEETDLFFSKEVGVLQNSFKDQAIQKFLGEKSVVYSCSNPQDYKIFIHNNTNTITFERLKEGLEKFDTDKPLYNLIKGQFVGNPMNYLLKANQSIEKPKIKSEEVYKELINYIENRNSNSSDKIALPNNPQSEVINYALNNCLTLVQGCFGAGKTYTISCLMKSLELQYGRGVCKILCCTGSNVASDNIAIYANKMNLSVIRVYSQQFEGGLSDYTPHTNAQVTALHYKVLSRLIPGYPNNMSDVDEIIQKVYIKTRLQLNAFEQWYKDNQIKSKLEKLKAKININYSDYKEKYNDMENQIIKSSSFIICTCSTAGDTRLSELYADAVIIDESSQCVEPEQILAISHTTKKVIIIGDTHQLPPVVTFQELQRTKYDCSLYERLKNMGIKEHMLTIQYRLHRGLLHLPNSLFYENKLKAGTKDEDRQLIFNNPGNIADILYDDFPSIFVDSPYKESQSGTSYINTNEAQLVIDIIKQLQSEKLKIPLSEIAIITMYKQQKHQLQTLSKFKAEDQLEINTVDSFQGREKEVIIISCVRSNENKQIGFLNDAKRINVALTRAKRLLIIVGNRETLSSAGGFWQKIINYYDEQDAIVEENDILD